MPIIPVEYSDFVIALLTIVYGIYSEAHRVSKNSVYWNMVFFIFTAMTTDLRIEFLIILVGYLFMAYFVVKREKTVAAVDLKELKKTIAFVFLGSRAYGSMLLSMALFDRGLLSWVKSVPIISNLVLLGSIGYALGGWLAILIAVHIIGWIIKRPP